MGTVVPYEDDLAVNAQPGITRYDAGYPIGAPVFHGTDDTEPGLGRSPSDIVEWTELNQDVGGGTGLADRNAYVLGGFDMPDSHDFRGDHPMIHRPTTTGAYGDVGPGSEDYATSYTQGIAAQDYETPTPEESWDAVSYGV